MFGSTGCFSLKSFRTSVFCVCFLYPSKITSESRGGFMASTPLQVKPSSRLSIARPTEASSSSDVVFTIDFFRCFPAGHWTPVTGHRPPHTGHRTPATGHRHRPPAIGHRTPDTGHHHRPPATVHRPPAAAPRHRTQDSAIVVIVVIVVVMLWSSQPA